jgi:hypothetical protein
MGNEKQIRKNTKKNKPEKDDLKEFIERKKIQNTALKKIIDKINEPGSVKE